MDQFWKTTNKFIKAVKDRYKNFGPGDLTSVFAKGPFCGWSERQLLEFAEQLDENQKRFPLTDT